MSLQLQNAVAWRLRHGATRRVLAASALFGRSCRRLDSAGERDRARRPVRHQGPSSR